MSRFDQDTTQQEITSASSRSRVAHTRSATGRVRTRRVLAFLVWTGIVPRTVEAHERREVMEQLDADRTGPRAGGPAALLASQRNSNHPREPKTKPRTQLWRHGQRNRPAAYLRGSSRDAHGVDNPDEAQEQAGKQHRHANQVRRRKTNASGKRACRRRSLPNQGCCEEGNAAAQARSRVRGDDHELHAITLWRLSGTQRTRRSGCGQPRRPDNPDPTPHRHVGETTSVPMNSEPEPTPHGNGQQR